MKSYSHSRLHNDLYAAASDQIIDQHLPISTNHHRTAGLFKRFRIFASIAYFRTSLLPIYPWRIPSDRTFIRRIANTVNASLPTKILSISHLLSEAIAVSYAQTVYKRKEPTQDNQPFQTLSRLTLPPTPSRQTHHTDPPSSPHPPDIAL